ncbi:CaiB/BaiF CoA transferase family protein [Hoeflea alexandrii]|uniref:CaiB/BaiF CoA transferase family protein n=1 Tax=Hoeflea alexandrii TaxID=288436 RepID=UPI0022B07042|nr:CoA transferase [Hoeflea alexandrii]MCZ4287720.1 CoA transferase [Hoeflea alexandrii]
MSLNGIRVVDLTRIISGPFCTQLLADLGADVIKIETIGGDPLREQGAKVNGFSWYFAAYNRNKRSVSLDLYSDEGKSILRQIIRSADVLVENFRPGVLDKMGLSIPELEELNSKLIVCNISGFGASGPYAQRPAFDFIAQALSGFMSVNGVEGEPPVRSGLPISDLVAGLYGALGVVSRLVDRPAAGSAPSGVQNVDISLTDSMVSLLSYMASDHLAVGRSPMRSGNDHPLVAPYGVFETADKPIALAPSNDGVYAKLLAAMDLQHLHSDPRFVTNADRLANRGALRDILEPIFKSAPGDHWIALLNKAGVPVGPILSVSEVFEDPQIMHRDMKIEVDHGDRGSVQMLGFPMKFSQESCEVRYPAPSLGEHSSQVLAEAGFSQAEIDAFVQNGVLRQD